MNKEFHQNSCQVGGSQRLPTEKATEQPAAVKKLKHTKKVADTEIADWNLSNGISRLETKGH